MKFGKEHGMWWQKASDISRNNCSFELMLGDQIVPDVGFSDSDIFEVWFSPVIASQILGWDELVKRIEEGREMAIEDKNSSSRE
jgi:hypothetical protein